jgi:hypothetical protein
MIMIATQRAVIAVALGLSLFPGFAMAQSTPSEEMAQKEAFLDILPKLDLPEDVKPIPGAVNEEFRNCKASWPAKYELSQKGPEARAYRDIYGLIKVRNVITTKDCTCAGKVGEWADVEAVANALREEEAVAQLTWKQTKDVFDLSNTLFPVAETMCGGSF